MKLIIAEKPSLAKLIAECMNENVKRENKYTLSCGDYLITALCGHILEHLSPEEYNEKYAKWREEDLPICFKDWKKKVSSSKRDVFNNVKELLNRKDIRAVINAGDMDSEGQLLVDEVLTYLHNTLPVLRLNTADTTPSSLYKSLTHLEDNNKYKGLSESAEARSVADMIFGFSFSRFFTLKSGAKLNVGRVKTPTLNLIVNRDRQIENFKAKKYYSIYFDSKKNNDSAKVKVELSDNDVLLDENGYLSDKDNADKIINNNNNTNTKGNVSVKREKEIPPLPFNLMSLQKHLETLYSFSPSKTMEITQNLRDKYNAITYNRSECEYLPSSYFENREKHIQTVLKNIGLSSFKEERDYKSKCFNDSKISLHFGIIPQDIRLNISSFTEDERKCYIEIAKRYLIQFMGDNIIEKKILTVNLKENRIAKANGKRYIKKGWLLLDKEKEDTTIPFDEGDIELYLENGEKTENETKPPKRYTQATLIGDMCRISRFVKDEKIKELLLRKDKDKSGDKGSIGTSATRDSIIALMIKQGYLEAKGKEIVSTPLGRDFIDLLPETVKSIDTTALWWEIQEKIENGEANIEDLTDKVVETFKDIQKNDKTEKRTDKEKDPYFETPLSYNYRVDSTHIRSIFKDNKYFKAIGWKPTKKDIRALLEKGVCKNVKIKDKKTNKEIKVNIKVDFVENKGSKFSNAEYTIEYLKSNK